MSWPSDTNTQRPYGTPGHGPTGPSGHGPPVGFFTPQGDDTRPRPMVGTTPYHRFSKPLDTYSGKTKDMRPAYTPVGRPQVQDRKTPVSPQQWPPAVKSYVERCFKACKPSQRPNLQKALKIIIQDSQEQGELWTRAWDSLPVPDLKMKPEDAAAIVGRVAAATRSICAGNNSARKSRFDVAPQAMRPDPRFGSPQQLTGYQPMQPVQPLPQQMRPSGGNTVRMDVLKPQSKMVSLNKTLNSNNKKRSFSAFQSSDSDSDVSQGGPFADDEAYRRQRRAGRFKDDEKMIKNSNKGKKAAMRRSKLAAKLINTGRDGEQIDWDKLALKGTCKKLEKSYFRLTSAPDPSTVRPEPILRKALKRLVDLIASGDVNYFYVQDQFKGLRQDCVIQAIKNDLAAQIYEAHARAALEYGDVAEYNQCQGQLRTLYADGIHSSDSVEAEFIAYRILYQSIHAHKGELVGLLHTLQQIGASKYGNHKSIKNALKVRSAIASYNFALFFQLYASAPGLGRALLDLAVPRLRFQALKHFVMAFKPTLSVQFIAKVLGFFCPFRKNFDKRSTDGPLPGCQLLHFPGKNAGKIDLNEAIEDCMLWLRECGATILDSDTPSEAKLDCKASMGKLRLPEEKDAVAHGDANLDLTDFLKSTLEEC